MYQVRQVLNSGGLLCSILYKFLAATQQSNDAALYKWFAIRCTPDFNDTTLKLISKPNFKPVSFR